MSEKNETDELYTYVLTALTDVVEGSKKVKDVLDLWNTIADEAINYVDRGIITTVLQQGREGSDAWRWVAGDLLRGYLKDATHGKKMELLSELARETGLTDNQARAYLDVAEYWAPQIRQAIQEKHPENTLAWSHFNRARRGLEAEEARKLVEDAADNNWSVRAMESRRLALTKEGEPSPDGSFEDTLRSRVDFATRGANSLKSLLSSPEANKALGREKANATFKATVDFINAIGRVL